MNKIFYLITCLLFFSCSRTEIRDFFPEKIPVSSTITISTGNARFEQTGIENEDRIADLNIFVFNGSDQLILSHFQAGYKMQIELPCSESEIYEILAIANAGKEVQARDRNELMNKTYDIERADDIGKTTGLAMMTGRITIPRIYDGQNIYIGMKRIISKINVAIETSGLNKDVQLKIDSIAICNMNCSTPLFGTGSVKDGDPTTRMNGELIGGKYCTFYVMENMQGNLLTGITDQKQKIFKEGDRYAERCTYLKIKGSYASPIHSGEISYRFYLGKNTLENFDVERNHSYDISVNFTGSGINEVSWRIDTSELKDHVTRLQVYPEEFTFDSVYDSKQFGCSVFPGTAFNQGITWKTGDKRVCSVSQDGTVTALNNGTCQIYAISDDRREIMDSATVHVSEFIEIYQVKIIPRIKIISLEETVQLDYECNPPNATRPEISPLWASSDVGVLTVTDGLLKPKRLGKAEIKMALLSNGNIIRDSMTVRVVEQYMTLSDIPVLYTGKPHFLKVNSSLTHLKPKFTSSDPRIATVTAEGVVMPKKAGTCTITASIGEYFSSKTATVRDPYIQLDNSEISIGIDSYGQISVLKSEPYDISPKWHIDNPAIAHIDIRDNGNACIIRGVSKGTTRLRVTLEYAKGVSISEEVTVNVTYSPISRADIVLLDSDGRFDRKNDEKLVDSRYVYPEDCFKLYGVKIYPETADPVYSVKWKVSADNGDPAQEYVEQIQSSQKTFRLKAKEFPKQSIHIPKRGMITLTAEITNASGERYVTRKHITLYEFLPIVPKAKQPFGAEIDFGYFHLNRTEGYFVLNLLKDSKPYYWPQKIRNGASGCWIFPIKSEQGYEISECIQINDEKFEIVAPTGSGVEFENFVRSLSIHQDYHYDDNIFVYVDLVFPAPY